VGLKPVEKVLYRTALPAYRLLWYAVDWLYPPYCGGCNQPGSNWCLSCQAASARIGNSVCRICGDPLTKGRICKECAAERPLYHSARSWALFEGPVQNVLHQLKYRNNIGLGNALAIHLAQVHVAHHVDFDLVVPVPLSRRRLAERGYNQAAMLAFPLSLLLETKYRPGALRKIVETRTQVGLNIAERNTNMKNAFKANPVIVSGKSILLIDDVMTTGATLNECARALLQAGAVKVNALTLARTKINDKII
jgi:ComF family protein